MTKFFVGLDLGQASDYTALSVLERLRPEGDRKEVTYHLRHLERVRDVPYPKIVDKITAMLKLSPLADGALLIVDQTGVGAPVVDLFRQARIPMSAIFIHGGDKVTREGDVSRVPKRDLAGVLQVLLQVGRLKISKKLPLAAVLQAELLNFKVKIDPKTAHDSYSAWREKDHDDLVLSVALAAWRAEREPPDTGPLVVAGARKKPGWSSTGGIRRGGDWFSEAARHHAGGQPTVLGGIHHRSR